MLRVKSSSRGEHLDNYGTYFSVSPASLFEQRLIIVLVPLLLLAFTPPALEKKRSPYKTEPRSPIDLGIRSTTPRELTSISTYLGEIKGVASDPTTILIW